MIGFNNTGSICWLNSLLQALIACPEFLPSIQNKNGLTNELLSPIDASYSQRVLKALRQGIEETGGSFNIAPSQECVSEGLTYLIDIINSKDTALLLAQKFNYFTKCTQCNDEKKSMDSTYMTWIPEDWNIPPVRTKHLIKSYYCDKCTQISEAMKIESMCYIGKIVIYTLNKIHKKYIHQGVPASFKIPALSGEAWIYNIQAVIVHYGKATSGHYVVYAKYGNDFYLFNDRIVLKSNKTVDQILIDPNIFMIIYCRQ